MTSIKYLKNGEFSRYDILIIFTRKLCVKSKKIVKEHVIPYSKIWIWIFPSFNQSKNWDRVILKSIFVISFVQNIGILGLGISLYLVCKYVEYEFLNWISSKMLKWMKKVKYLQNSEFLTNDKTSFYILKSDFE